MPAPFETISGEQLEKVLSKKPYRYHGALYQVQDIERGSQSAINFRREYAVTQRHRGNQDYVLGVYDPELSDSRGSGPLLCAFRLRRLR